MARTKRTRRKNLSPLPSVMKRITKFHTFKMDDDHDVERFLNRFCELWVSVTDDGVTELDGVLQLARAVPQRWRPWASMVALDFVHPDMELRVTGKLFDFVDLVQEQLQSLDQPPFGPYPPLSQFIPSVHKILDDILAFRRRAIDVSLPEPINEITPSPEYPDIGHAEFPYCTGPGITSIDLDLYGQPFALEPPSPPYFLLSPLSDDRLASTSGNVGNELETHSPVGTSRVQSLTLNETSFANEFQNPNLGAPVGSGASSSHPQDEEEEEDPETPEGYGGRYRVQFED